METKIFDYGMNGEGISKIDGKIVLVNHALCNETIELEIIEDNKNYSIGKIVNVLQASQNRINPICPYFDMCGGCQLQHMSYNEQLKFKALNIKKTIKKICNLDIDVKPCIPCSKPFNYRNKMSFSVQNSKCGLLEQNSKNIIDITHCTIASENINQVLSIFKKFLLSNPQKEIKNLVVRDIENQILVGVVATKHLSLKPLYDQLSKTFNSIGLYEIINTRNDSVVLAGKINHIAGIKEIKINNFCLTYSVDLMGFHQTNLEIQNKLYTKVLEYIDTNSIVINGFSGQGLLSAIVATKAKQVMGIEINKSSHVSAELLKKTNDIKNLKNICGDFFKEILKLKTKSNTLILDPTKKGCGKQVMNKINGFEKIVYISCNPIALCKDLNIIKDDYIIEEITPFDMFPNTSSVETLVVLKKKI